MMYKEVKPVADDTLMMVSYLTIWIVTCERMRRGLRHLVHYNPYTVAAPNIVE